MSDERVVCVDCGHKIVGPIELHRALWCEKGPNGRALQAERDVHAYMAQHYSPHEAAQVLGVLGNQRDGIDPGDFKRKLIDLAFKCDRQNLVRLSYGFPSIVAAVWDHKYGGGEAALVEKVHDQWKPKASA